MDLWCSRSRLEAAWGVLVSTRSLDGRRPPPVGVDGMGAEHFEAKRGLYLDAIARRLSQPDGEGRPTRYQLAPLLRREIRKLGDERTRVIYVPRIRDQIVLKALSLELKRLLPAFGCPLPPSSPATLIRTVIHEGRRRGHTHVLRTDIQSYFATIPHPGLFAVLAGLDLHPTAEDMLRRLICETPVRPAYGTSTEDRLLRCGLPTGTSVCTYLAQLYLHAVDVHFADRSDLLYLRYMDDLLLAAPDAATLGAAAADLENALTHRGLSLSPHKTERCTFAEGFSFLGFRFAGDRLLLRPEKVEAWFRRFERLKRRHHRAIREAATRAEARQAFGALVLAFNRELSGVDGMHVPYYAIADNLEVYRSLDGRLRRLLGGLYRKLEVTASGPYRLASAHGWAWRYKRNRKNARARARRLYSVAAPVEQIPGLS